MASAVSDMDRAAGRKVMKYLHEKNARNAKPSSSRIGSCDLWVAMAESARADAERLRLCVVPEWSEQQRLNYLVESFFQLPGFILAAHIDEHVLRHYLYLLVRECFGDEHREAIADHLIAMLKRRKSIPMRWDPEVFNKQKIGCVFNTKFDGRRLPADAWIDVQRVALVDPRVEQAVQSRQMMEVSTGLALEAEEATGTYNSKRYQAVARWPNSPGKNNAFRRFANNCASRVPFAKCGKCNITEDAPSSGLPKSPSH